MSGTRVDLRIMELRPELTRTTVKKLIINGAITVNREKVMPNYRLKEDDIINIDDRLIKEFLSSDEEGLYSIKPRKINLEIIYEDEHLVVVNKPEGFNSHPATRKDDKSVLNGLVYHIAHQEKFAKEIKIRLIHRLDKETSGVLLSAKNLQSNDYYSKQFEHHNIKKEYLAVVHGDFEAFLTKKKIEDLYITTYISNNKDENELRYKNTSPDKGRPARSRVFFERHFNKFGRRKFSLVRVFPETGRTHQIRVHLSGIGFPILGDTLYGGQKYKRLMLHSHAVKLQLYPTGEELVLKAEMPEKFVG
jgi:23S rRNA pseudouridine1911/1915/1917 synthase